MWGISIDQNYHWIVGQIAFFICQSNTGDHGVPRFQWANKMIVSAGIQMGNTVITAYIVDCYPLQSMSVITFYSVFLNLSAFISPVSTSSIVFSSSLSWYELPSRKCADQNNAVLHHSLANKLRLDTLLRGARHHHLLRLRTCLSSSTPLRSSATSENWTAVLGESGI